MTFAQYRIELMAELKRVFGADNVQKEWDVAKNSLDNLTREQYCPRIDFAVGPFNIDRNSWINTRRIDKAYREHAQLFRKLEQIAGYNNRTIDSNYNPRCFLAIELENKTSRKHRLGSLINASAMAKMGIVLASDEKVLQSLLKIRKYLNFLQEAWKFGDVPKNILILRNEDFLVALRKYQ